MTITESVVSWFEQEQAIYGTRVALYNLLYLDARGLNPNQVSDDPEGLN